MSKLQPDYARFTVTATIGARSEFRRQLLAYEDAWDLTWTEDKTWFTSFFVITGPARYIRAIARAVEEFENGG